MPSALDRASRVSWIRSAYLACLAAEAPLLRLRLLEEEALDDLAPPEVSEEALVEEALVEDRVLGPVLALVLPRVLARVLVRGCLLEPETLERSEAEVS